MIIQEARTQDDVARLHPVMVQLRPHLSLDAFVDQVSAQQAEDGYRLAYAEDAGEVRAVAGFRTGRMLHRGKFLYVDDLIADDNARSKGYGGALLDWLVAEARRLDCDQICLESGVHRFDAHRFYFTKRMHISSYHFTRKLNE